LTLQLPVHVGRSDAIGIQSRGVQFNPDFAIRAAIAIDLADAALTLKRPFDGVVDKPGRLFQRHIRAH
jgi:hypothetical protein